MLVARLLGKTAVVVAVAGLLLFDAAGTLAWPQAWILLLLLATGSLGSGLVLLDRDPGLLAQRLGSIAPRDQPVWDRLFMVAVFALGLCWFVLMGFDRRLGWSSMPLWPQGLGILLYAASVGLTVRVFLENSFAAPTVRIQSERGQHVVDTGPYAIVRHPMYTVATPSVPALALVLGSWWGLLATGIFAALIVARTVAEDRLLREGLDGYAEYARRVPFRLVPGLW